MTLENGDAVDILYELLLILILGIRGWTLLRVLLLAAHERVSNASGCRERGDRKL